MTKSFWLLPAVVLLAACGASVPTPGQGQDELAQVNRWIAPAVQGTDRQLLVQAMLLVPDAQRKDFTLITEDGRVLSNAGLRAASAVGLMHPVRVSGNIYRYVETGETFIVPDDTLPASTAGLSAQAITCAAGANTGGFYRSISKPGPGASGGQLNFWSAAQSSVILPGTVNVKYAATSTSFTQLETPYVILGGWGSNNPNLPIDAGLQGNLKRVNGVISVEWQIFLKVGASVAPSSSTVRFRGGQDVLLNFVVAPASVGATTPTAYLTASSGGQSVSVQLAASGWSINGATNVMKRLTGIAQSATTINGSSLDTTTWQNINIGGYKTISPPFFASTYVSWSGNGQYQCFNPNASSVTLSDISIWDYFEDVSIFMR